MSTQRAQLLVDLGNTRLKCAILDLQGDRGEVIALAHAGGAASVGLQPLLERFSPGDHCWLASVASSAVTLSALDTFAAAGLVVHRVQASAREGRLRIAYADPSRLGVDRFLAMLAASARDDGPWVLVSAGSALTVDLLDADGLHLGGVIAPMPAQMRVMLAERFSQLDVPEGQAQPLADNTADAIASGVQGAALGLVERVLRHAQLRLGTMPTLLLGGGDARLLAEVEHPRIVEAPALVLDGLAMHARAGSG